MAAVTVDASPATDPGLRGPVPARTSGPAAADRSPATVRPGRTVRSWPLLVLAAPAAAEVWSGWVGIAQKTGFGLVSPLPGIWPSLHLDTAITLPVGVEAYAAYALRAWLASEHTVSARTRRFAKWSAIFSFALGMAGQVAYHLLAQAGSGAGAVAHHHDRVLPAGPGPGHGDRAGPHAARRRRRSPGYTARPGLQGQPPHDPRTGPPRTSSQAAGAGPGDRDHSPDQSSPGTTEPLVKRGSAAPSTGHPVLDPAHPRKEQALRVGRELADSGRPVSRRALRSAGVKGSNEALNALARMINAELLNKGTVLP